jgi:uncharacterized membrane protein
MFLIAASATVTFHLASCRGAIRCQFIQVVRDHGTDLERHIPRDIVSV